MNKYLTTFAIHFQDAIVYRTRLLIWLLADLWMVVMPFIWLAVFKGSDGIGTFTRTTTIQYFFFMPLVNSLVVYYTYFPMHNFVKDGQVANHITKPIQHLAYQSVGEAAHRLWITLSLIPIMTVIYLFLRHLIVVPSFAQILTALPFIVIAILLNLLMATIIGMVSFWTIQAEWVQHAWWMIHSFTAGYVAPLSFYPATIQDLLSLTPFPLFLSVPLEALIGTLPAEAFGHWLAVGLAWIPLLLVLNIIMWKRAVHHVDAVGM